MKNVLLICIILFSSAYYADGDSRLRALEILRPKLDSVGFHEFISVSAVPEEVIEGATEYRNEVFQNLYQIDPSVAWFKLIRELSADYRESFSFFESNTETYGVLWYWHKWDERCQVLNFGADFKLFTKDGELTTFEGNGGRTLGEFTGCVIDKIPKSVPFTQ